MPITDQELIAGIEAKNGFPLDDPQKDAITYGTGPLLIAAGPGTGKTEVLVARCLKFMCCDSVPPGSIMLTTFTEKAAKNLQDRLSEAFPSSPGCTLSLPRLTHRTSALALCTASATTSCRSTATRRIRISACSMK
jgi:superfamily I DNA/RNA helicase